MKILIEAPFDLDDTAKQEIKDQINRLEKYSNQITQVDVFFKLDDGIKPDVVLAEVQLHVPGPVIFAADTNEQYMTALIAATKKAKVQLLKNKSIQQDY